MRVILSLRRGRWTTRARGKGIRSESVEREEEPMVQRNNGGDKLGCTELELENRGGIEQVKKQVFGIDWEI